MARPLQPSKERALEASTDEQIVERPIAGDTALYEIVDAALQPAALPGGARRPA